MLNFLKRFKEAKENMLMSKSMNMQKRLFNLILLVFMLSCIGATMLNCILSFDIAAIAAVVILIAVVAVFYFIANRSGNYEKCAAIACMVIVPFILPAVFFVCGGIDSGMPIWMVLGLICSCLMLKSRTRIIVVSFEILVYAATFIFSYLYPEWVVPIDTVLYQYIDILQAIFVVSLLLGFIVTYQINEYEKLSASLEKQNEQLSAAYRLAEEANVVIERNRAEAEKARAEAEQLRLAEKQAREEAERANSEKTTFLANVSHEIRTPMNVIMGMSEITLREELSDDVRSNISDILNASRNLLSIINDVLDITKVEAGRIELIENEYSLFELISDVSTMTHIRIGDKEIQFGLVVNQSIPNCLKGDCGRMRQIIMNLLSNAVKYTSEGAVILKLGWTDEDDKALLRIDVIDTGIGIKEEDMGRLFSKFERLDVTKNQNIEGTGLGLVITKQFITLMGGSISVVSQYGMGSTFTAYIPQTIVNRDFTYGEATKLGKNKQSAIRAEKFCAPEARVMVVDDNSINLKVAQGLLKPYGMHLFILDNARECLNLAGRESFDLIFLDHMMPDIDGIECLHRLRSLPNTKDVPIIIMTANAVTGMSDMYLEEGFSGYLPKPVGSQKLAEILDRWIPASRRRINGG